MTLANPWFIAMLVVGGGLWLYVTVAARRQPRSSNGTARRMATARQLEALSPKAAAKTAKRLGAPTPGLTIGRAMRGQQALVQDWEACSLDIAGPRASKTTSRVIPAILDAPGAVVTTSNKRDALDATRGPRSAVGPVWVFDPQRLVGEPASWWWNPLRAVTDEIKAAELADVFAAAVTSRDSRTDAFFDGKARKVVAALLLAAAEDGRMVDDCHRWVTDAVRAEQAVKILRRAGHELSAASLHADLQAPEKQRDGVLGSAERLLAFLTHREAVTWVTPGYGRPEFDPAEFVKGTGTLYLLSREGAGNAGALVAALTAAVADAAEQLATRSRHGRLAVPLCCVLDEAANVARIPTLPALYSHYGSRGIALMTFLQSYSQGAEVWGQHGMRTLWSAATVKVYGGGVAEADFLEDLSRLVGEWDRPTVSTSSARGGRSTTRGTTRSRILPIDALASLPRGQAVVLAAGMPPTLARLIPWMDGPHARAIRAYLDDGAQQ